MIKGNLLARLHKIQDSYGYIPESEIDKLAKQLKVPRAKIFGVIRFYSMLYTEPTGKYIVRICNSLSCYLNDSEGIVQTIKDYLKIDSGETTEDKKFSLEIVECLGYCGEGPVMMINDQIYTHLSKTKALDLLNNCI